MGIVELAGGIILELLKGYNSHQATKRSDNIAELRTKLAEQRARGQYSDDGEVERLVTALKIELEALNNDILTGAIRK